MAQSLDCPPMAQPGPVTNDALGAMIVAAHDLQNNNCTHEGLALLVQNMGACLEELLDFRCRAAASIELDPANALDLTNVVQLPRHD